MRTSKQLTVGDEDRRVLERVARVPSTPQKVAVRARIVLLSGEGQGTGRIVAALATTAPTVILWRKRYEQGGVAAVVHEASRPGCPPQIRAGKVAEVVERTLEGKPAGATHWSTRTLAPVVGLSHTQVHRIWRAHALWGMGTGRGRPDESGSPRALRMNSTPPTRPWPSSTTRTGETRYSIRTPS